MKHRSATEAVQAMLALDLPGTVDMGQLPTEIQWAPPGRHQIQATRNGEPATVDVIIDKEAARKVARTYDAYVAAVSRNEEDLPYFDENHDDREAVGHPTGFRWAGDDPQQGGIRAKVTWTDRGKKALLGKNYRRFSPSFFLDGDGKISGAPVNMGGLVNRAAFKRIAPVIAKGVEQQALLTGKNFIDVAAVIARSRNLQEHEAAEMLARERPDLYLEYRTGLGLGNRRDRDLELTEAREVVRKRRSLENDEFMIEARALASALDLPIEDAFLELCRARPILYERYRAKLYGRDLDARRVAEVRANAVESPFLVAAESVAAARSVDLTEAFEIVARENPDLYDAYHREFY